MIHRRTFLCGLTLGGLAAPLGAQAQQPVKTPRVGLLGLGPTESSPIFQALRQGLREQGYVEGQTIVFEDRSTVDVYTRLPDVAAELVRLKVDVIVAFGTTTAQATRKATATIPIVAIAGSLVESGRAASLGRPGGNVTGLQTISQELIGKRVELLKEALPGVSRVAVLWNPESRTQPVAQMKTETAARALGLDARSVEVRRPEDLEKAFARMAKDRAEALFSVGSNFLLAHRARVVELAARYRLPSAFDGSQFVEAGGLMSYGASLTDQGRRAADFVDRILKGAKPGDLPVEQPTKFELVINLKTAKALGLTIPASLLARSDQVIE